jgi:hypothetical protein
MSEETNNTPNNIVPIFPEIPASNIHPESLEQISKETGVPVSEIDGAGGEVKPRTMQEMIASVDLTGATPDTIIVELIGEIQKLAFSATIALGLLERLNAESKGDEQPSAEEETK